MWRPPVTSSTVPVRYDDRSLARNSATDATSDGSPNRPIGMSRRRCSRMSSRIPSIMGVRIRPGWIALTRTPAREVTLVQRKTTPIGIGLGKTSGWAHRAVLKQSGVVQVVGASYTRVDDDGLHLVVDGEERVLEVDHVVLCAGQESVRGLYDDLVAAGTTPHLIGGADVAAELDAKRAIEQGTRVAAGL